MRHYRRRSPRHRNSLESGCLRLDFLPLFDRLSLANKFRPTKMIAQLNAIVALLSISYFCTGCAVPQFDVPYTAEGPTVDTVVRRIECEMREMVVLDNENPASFNSKFLLNNDYDVAIALSLDVTNTGGLAPSFSYLNPVSSFAFGGTGTLSEARDHNFTENIQLSFRRIFMNWKQDNQLYQCPPANTNFCWKLGNKGLRRFGGSDPAPRPVSEPIRPRSIWWDRTVSRYKTDQFSRSGVDTRTLRRARLDKPVTS